METLAAIAISLIGNAIVVIWTSGKTQGVINTKITALDQRTEKVEDDNRQQWKEISKHTAEIGYLQGKVNGKARGMTP